MDDPKILVIEDDPLVQRVLRLQLESRGCTVTICTTGEAGIDVARSAELDLIILDLMMPAMSGFDVLRELESDGASEHAPILILTASHDSTHRQASESPLVNSYLTKPYGERELWSEINRVLSSKTTC